MCAYKYIEIYNVKSCLQALWNLYIFGASHTVRENAVQKRKSMP